MEPMILILSALAAVCAAAGLVLSLAVLSRTKQQNFSEDFARQRKEMNDRLDSMQNNLTTALNAGLSAGNTAQTNAIAKLSQETQATLTGFSGRIDKMNDTTEKRLQSIQEENRKKLDEMQGVVNDKLETALERRVAESFKLVNERLELVSKGLTEMQGLATGVGDLKKILSNVKTRGIFGEIQLSRILEQILTPAQYDENVATVPGSAERVEFAVRLPGKDDRSVVYLPIDSKFPLDKYEQLTLAAESGDVTALENARKALAVFLKFSAKEIYDKYIQPPHTTDFGILFLPTEGLYAEVVRMTDLTEALMRDYSINVAGPSTLAALLNSLQMGFRTLAIEKRSNDVWQILSAVKTEFNTFEGALEGVKKRLDMAGNDLEKLVGTRTRAIQRKLRDVETLPSQEAQNLLDGDIAE